MRSLYNENQARLKEHAGEYSGPQNEIQQKVAGQRSENEQNINKSAGEIGKKQSTVQASSDILKGETSNVQGKFALEYENEKGHQKFISQDADEADVKAKLAEIRKRAG